MTNTIDMSRELVLHRHHNGVQLRRPSVLTTDISLADILNKRISVYFLSRDHVFIDANQHQLECLNCSSFKDVIDHPISDHVNNPLQLNHIIGNNLRTVGHHTTLFFDECVEVNDLNSEAISVKMPWYDSDNNILGVFGFSHIINGPCEPSNRREFTDVVNAFFESDNPSYSPVVATQDKPEIFTKRQLDIINLILRGKSIRECAALLNLSPRTAEHYYAKIKHKANVQTRSELIERLIKQGYAL